jgi:multiple sugar transport system substrate-binding protein
MEEITFSVFNHGPAATEALDRLLLEFEKSYGIKVRLEVIPTWSLGWSRLVENALYRSGPDISEAGNTWIGDLAKMEALHPFKLEEVVEITKHARLFENVWKSRVSNDGGAGMLYSIPWTGDSRAVFYRRDLLEKADVDESTAFIDTAHFEKTVSSLKNMGYIMPLVLTTLRSSLTIHYIASWIWSAGGDFLSPDGINLAFDQPRAL